MFFSRAWRDAWRVSRARLQARRRSREAHLLRLGLVDVLHQNALVLEHVALHLHSARDVSRRRRACERRRRRAFRYISWYMCLSIFFESRYLRASA